MSPIAGTSIVPDDQVALAHARVHGRLRRRRNRVRGAGAAAMACVALLGVGIATQGREPGVEAPVGPDAMAPGGSMVGRTMPDQDGMCGRFLTSADALGLELAIEEPLEWRAPQEQLGLPGQVVVVARNVGTRPVTISLSPGVVALDDGALVVTEPDGPVLVPTTVTLEPSERIELPAGLPYRSCTGDALGSGTYTIVPVAVVEIGGRSPVVAQGAPLTVQRR